MAGGRFITLEGGEGAGKSTQVKRLGAALEAAILEFLKRQVLIKEVIGPHELFHVSVLIGISFHWCFVFRLAQSRED